MATAAAARSVFRSSLSSFRSAASRFASGVKLSPSPFRSVNNIPLSSRLLRDSSLLAFRLSPVQLSACLETMQPFHTVTASALLTSMLSFSRCGYGWLEGW